MTTSVESTKHVGGHVKGAALREFVLWSAQQPSARAVRATVSALPDTWRRMFNEHEPALGVVVSTWYPAAVVHRLLDAATAGLDDKARTEFAFAAARAMMQGMLTGVYKTLFSMMATPERFARHGHQLWASVYDTGRWSGELTGQQIRTQTRFWSGHHPILCQLTAATAIPLLEAMGRQDVEVHQEACLSRGDAECRYVIRWT